MAMAHQQHLLTRLYDQGGNGIRDAARLTAVLDDAVWLVPVIALTESTGEATADRQVSSGPTTQELDVQTAGFSKCRFPVLAKRYVVRDGGVLDVELSSSESIDE